VVLEHPAERLARASALGFEDERQDDVVAQDAGERAGNFLSPLFLPCSTMRSTRSLRRFS
jgi:hypothetical protein